MKVTGWIAFFIFWIVICYLLISLREVDAFDGQPRIQEESNYSLPIYLSFIGVMMTSITVVLAAVAIGIGIVAAYTFSEIKGEAIKVANETAQKRANEALSEEVIQRRIDAIAFGSIQKRQVDELEQEFDPDDQSER